MSTARSILSDLSVFYFTDTLDPSSETSNSRMFFDGGAAMAIDKKGRYYIGWNIAYYSYALESSSNSEITSIDNGPRFTWLMNKRGNWALNLVYNVFSRATFNSGSGDLSWRGGSYKADVTYLMEATETFYIGLKLAYYSASYSEQFDSSNAFTEIETSQSFIYPSLAMSYRF